MSKLMHMGGVPAHLIRDALQGRRDVEIHVDNPRERFEEVRAQDGVVDVIVWNAGTHLINNTFVYGFNRDEDLIYFRGMGGQDLYIAGGAGETVLTPADHDKNADGNIVLVGTPHNSWGIMDAILPFAGNGATIFDGTFFPMS